MKEKEIENITNARDARISWARPESYGFRKSRRYRERCQLTKRAE